MKKDSLIKTYGLIIIGSFIFALAVNLFIVPSNLYNGGCIGIAQVIRTILFSLFKIKELPFDIAGLIYLGLNIPLLILAYRSLSHNFLYGTLCSVITQTLFMTLIPIPATPIMNDLLASVIVGGFLSAFGIGLCLQQGASGGGTDIIGVYASMKWKSFTVGKLTLWINAGVYLVCAFLFSLPIAIYSVLYSAIFSMVMDKIHLQNIAMSAMIFTKNKDVKKMIIQDLVRGVTYWHGQGAYTDTDTEILVTIISKYEINNLKERVHAMDPKAFIIINEGMQVQGNYEKRLIKS